MTRREKRGETSPSVTERKESVIGGDARVEAEKGHITFYLYFLAAHHFLPLFSGCTG